MHFTHELGRTDDRLDKIRDVINMLRKSFSDAFHPYQELCIDESLMLYTGRLFSSSTFRRKGVDLASNRVCSMIVKQVTCKTL